MFRRILKPLFILPIFLILEYPISYSMSTEDIEDISIESILNKRTLIFSNIDDLIIENNIELQSLQILIESASFNLSSKISTRYPSIDLSANGLPQYLYGENFSNNSSDTVSSQYSINPSLNLRWDLIDPLRGTEIKLARNNFEIAKNNYEIKKRDLIFEAKSRYHNYQKSYADIQNAEVSLELSLISLRDAEAKLEAGTGTQFEVLEANAQMSRDKQNLEEKRIIHEINKIALKEILNINLDQEFEIEHEQSLIGFWNHSLAQNIQSGIENSFSLKNLNLQNLIKQNQADSFLNANKPTVYISNTFSSSFTWGSTLTTEIDPDAYGSSFNNKISLNFNWPIFSGGQNQNSFTSKELEAEAEIFAYENLVNIIEKDISETYLNLIRYEKNLLTTEQEINAIEESLRLVRLRYETGISTLKDVLVIQKELSSARSKRINAIHNYNLTLNKLERLTFLFSDENCTKINSDDTEQIESICDY